MPSHDENKGSASALATAIEELMAMYEQTSAKIQEIQEGPLAAIMQDYQTDELNVVVEALAYAKDGDQKSHQAGQNALEAANEMKLKLEAVG